MNLIQKRGFKKGKYESKLLCSLLHVNIIVTFGYNKTVI